MNSSLLKLRSDIWSSRVFLLIVFAGLCLLGSSNLQRWQVYCQDIEEAEKTTLNLSRALAQHAQDSVGQADLILSGLGFWVENLDAGSGKSAKLQQLFAQRMEEAPLLQNLTLLDERGQRQLAARTAPGQSPDNSDRDYFKWHRDHPEKQPLVGKPLRSRSTGTWIMTVSRRINHPDGSFAGVLLASINLDFFKQYYDQFNIGEQGLILLSHEDGTLMVRRPAIEQAIGTRVKGSVLFAKIGADQRNGNLQAASALDGVERIYGFQRLDRYPLVVVVALGRAEVLDNWWQRTLKINLALLIILAFLTVLAWRLHQQQSLRVRSQAQLRLITDNLPMLVSYVDQQQRYLFLNASYARAYGMSTEEIIGMRVPDLIGAAAYVVAQPHLQAALAGQCREFDNRASKLGSERDFRVQMRPQFNVSGGVDGVIIIVTDISTDRARERELKKSYTSLERAQSLAHVGSWEYDCNSGIITWSDELYRIFGHAPGAVVPDLQRVIDAVHPEDRARCVALYYEAFGAHAVTRMAFRIIRPDGSVRHLIDSLAIVNNDAGLPEVLLGALIDVTDRVQGELKAKASQERELVIGYGIQQALLLADVPAELNGAWIDTLIEPSQGLHGDFVAVSQHSPTRFNLLVGDVMGKGIHAAMIGAGIKNTYYQLLAELMAVAIDTGEMPKAATLVNALHAKMTPKLISMNSFVTLALYAFDVEAGTITYVNAGHTPAMLTRHGATQIERLEGDNLPLGVLLNEVYVEHAVAVRKDDQLVVYSDGISEAVNRQGEEFGVAGIADWLSRCNLADVPAAAALQLLRHQLAQSGDDARIVDDKTVMIVRMREPTPMPGAAMGARPNPDYLSVPMCVDALPALRERLNLLTRDWPAAEADAVLLAVFEAATNAVRHTPQPLPDATLSWCFTVLEDSLTIDLFYQGAPVVLDEVDQPDFSGARDGGFGLHIMRSILDEIRYEAPLPGLVHVRMAKRCVPIMA